MCGITLKHTGHDVTILERAHDERESHMAGVCLGQDAEDWLTRHDRHSIVFTHRSSRVQLLKGDGTLHLWVNGRRDITNWDTLYFRLRSLFDGLKSSHYPSPPEGADTDGRATFESRREVLSVSCTGGLGSGGQAVLQIRNCDDGVVSVAEADLIIAADGPNSTVRAQYLAGVERKYVGYVAWRGTVPEEELTPSTRYMFRRSITVFQAAGRSHCVVYTIPGEHGSLQPGKRLLNFLWYTNETTESLDKIMRDSVSGHRHHYLVPAGRVREDIWNSTIRQAHAAGFPEPLLDIITHIQRPFIQVITDFCSPRAAFQDGRVLLLGDGLSLLRPHTAFSGTQAAFHCIMVEDYINGKISLEEWEEKVLRYSRLHWAQSAWWGEFYQSRMVVALCFLARYWWYCCIDLFKYYLRGDRSLLRTSSRHVEEYDED